MRNDTAQLPSRKAPAARLLTTVPALRLYPVVPGSSRIAITRTILPTGGGVDGHSPILVQPGTLVIFHMAAVHVSASLWGPDAGDFNPERWLDKDSHSGDGNGKEKAHPWRFLPFGGGPRNCIGQQFARIEVAYTVVRLLQCFTEVESRDGREWRERVGASCCNDNGVKVGMVAR